MHHATRAKAERLVEMLAAEYPRLTLEAVYGDEIDHDTYTNALGGFEVTVDGDDVVWEGDKVPELADILDACAEQDIDPTESDDEEEEEVGGSIVPEGFRQWYREASTTGQGNGDWLYETLASWTLTEDGKNIPLLHEICLANGVDPDATKWGQARLLETRGWKGRYSMSARIALEMPLCRTGLLRHADGTPTSRALTSSRLNGHQMLSRKPYRIPAEKKKAATRAASIAQTS